ncbi:MAG TPA: type II secretion system F family protein [Pirellulaceae bacterium]|nr:type II secretion system F family protein [Pirellulaceae bacterium]
MSARPVTLEQLAALSDEIGALARAGVPLDRGLWELSQDMPGRMGKLAGDISQRLEAGASLEQVVAELGSALPPAYRSVIAAGVRAGRLSLAMEGISHTARRIGQLRTSIYLSLLYPLMVLWVTYSLSVFVLVKIGPVLSRMLVDFDVAGSWIVSLYDAAARHCGWLGPLLPFAFAAWLAWAWIRSGQIAEGRELHPLLAFGAVGTLARLQRASRLASLADLLSLLVGNAVPLPEAVELASAAVGSPRLAKSGKELAAQLRRGETIQKAPAGFPPLLAWTIAGGQSQPRLVRALTRAAEVYREEIARRSQWLAFYVPMVVTTFICGGIVLIYAALTLGPWLAIMRRVAEPF